jgi:hypothetical protein
MLIVLDLYVMYSSAFLNFIQYLSLVLASVPDWNLKKKAKKMVGVFY